MEITTGVVRGGVVGTIENGFVGVGDGVYGGVTIYPPTKVPLTQVQFYGK